MSLLSWLPVQLPGDTASAGSVPSGSTGPVEAAGGVFREHECSGLITASCFAQAHTCVEDRTIQSLQPKCS